MKTYTKFLTKLFLKCFIKIFMIFFTVVLITSILEELQFFKQENIDFFLLTFLALLTTPSVLFEILPFIFLISTQFYFTKLIDANELEIFKFNGLDNLKILKIVSIISFLLGIVFILVFYNFSSILKNEYVKIKNKYSNDNKYLAVINNNGLWIKDIIDDKINIINAKEIKEDFLIDVLIVQFNKNFELLQSITSEKIDISTLQWKMTDSEISSKNETNKFKNISFSSNFNSEKINSLFSNLSSQSIFDLINLRETYKSLNYSLIEIDSQLFKIISYPFYLTLVTILTVIIMYNVKYQKNNLYRIILGIFLSVIIYYINNFFKVMGVNEKIPLLLSIWFPLIILLLINITFIMKLNEK
jgi:lipopolysaccharide export system permease protein